MKVRKKLFSVFATAVILITGVAKANDLTELTATEALKKLKNGQMTSLQYVNALIEEANQQQGLNSFIYFNPQQVRADAAKADRLRRTGHHLGPLHGLPILVKDNIDTADITTTAGTPGLTSNVPQKNAPVLQALLKAGAILMAKTNMHELAFGITSNNAAFGPVHNPYDLTRIAGGSSGGNGSALAARIAPVALGTDTGGSVRIPAALNGIVGFRPTSGRYPQSGIVPIAHTLDTAGPMARSVEDVALLDSVIAGQTNISDVSLRGMRFGAPSAYFRDNLHPEVAQAFARVLTKLRSKGAVIVEVEIPNIGSLEDAAGFPIALYESVRDLPSYLTSHGVGVDFQTFISQIASPDVKGLLQSISGSGAIPDEVYQNALSSRTAMQAAFKNYFKVNKVSAILYPSTPLPAALIGEDVTVELNGQQVPTFPTYTRNTLPTAVSGIPCLVVPMGMTNGGLPMGLEIAGLAGKDRELLSTGVTIQKLLGLVPSP